MHPAISINTLSLGSGQLDQHVAAVSRLAARAIAPGRDDIEGYGVAESARLFGDAGLVVAALTHRAFGFADAGEAQLARRRLDETIDMAREIGARAIVFTTGGRGVLAWAEACARFADEIAPSAAKAREAGVILALEPTSHLYADASIAHRLRDTQVLADAANIGISADLFPCWVDADLPDAIVAAAPRTAVIQVSDYVYGDRGLPCRAVPGDGAVPLEDILTCFVAKGFRGHYDLEIIGPRITDEGYEAGLRRAGDYIGAILDRAGAPNPEQ